MKNRKKEILKYQYTENIREKGNKLIEDLNLKANTSINDFIERKKRFYAADCKTKGGEKVFLKILLVEDAKVEKLFKNEIKANLLAQKEKEIAVPKIIKFDIENPPYFFMRDFVGGEDVGYFYDISKDAQNEKIAKEVASNLFAIQNIDHKKFNFIFDEKRRFVNYKKIIKEREEKILPKDKKGVDMNSIYRLLEETIKKYGKIPLVPCHGDYTLANFILFKERVYVIDWEHFRLDNFCVDLAHLWVETWKFPKWRKTLLTHFLSLLTPEKQKTFKEIFRIVVIGNALGGLAYGIHICPEKDSDGAKKTAKSAINAALTSFDSLLKE